MFKKELEELFNGMPQVVKDKLQPVMDNLLERAGEVDEYSSKDPEYYEEERAEIVKEVNKIKYLNDQWKIMSTKNSN
ncbi:MAG: hypothetical protein BM557_09220 [Flavobacterium sp. MedPE-SWcel]|uniref:hypothetical protein n=1 Tax=uncultured Flavobacterium sp. TaxID=165435 RepID=UPI00091849F6|nr:hypothetical protein [uncultured Flavobacterium sp.]OIQ16919.1 MAG: hypothetical protein BM557_09220 [Flavobacterium sp. MedPE-SWcel]